MFFLLGLCHTKKSESDLVLIKMSAFFVVCDDPEFLMSKVIIVLLHKIVSMYCFFPFSI